jgi:hypothetical protein
VLVTGWRDWPADCAHVVWDALDSVLLNSGRPLIVVHGQCPYGGVDLYAHQWAMRCDGANPEPHPAERDANDRLLGPARNSHMVSLGAELCLAFPGPGSRGTVDCAQKAINADIPTMFFAWSSTFAEQWKHDDG